jgi:glycosyltransferase involved in cell wall biosynthesis
MSIHLSASPPSLVSIIIPCYNGERYLEESINSALNQTYSRFEVIVIDDGSTDGSLEIIKSFGDKVRWESGPNRGGGGARNRGLELARGEWIKFQDADDVLLPECLAGQMAHSEALAESELSFGYGVDLASGQRVSSEGPAAGEEMVGFCFGHDILTPTVLHRRCALEAIGGFDESLAAGQEWNLHVRLALAGYRFVHFNACLFRYRDHQGLDRVSMRKKQSPGGFIKGLEGYLKILWLLEQRWPEGSPNSLRCAVFNKLTEVGRITQRRGHRQEAAVWYCLAARYTPDGWAGGGGRAFSLLRLFVGPLWAESLLGFLRNQGQD